MAYLDKKQKLKIQIRGYSTQVILLVIKELRHMFH
jgi:hypothetical protein